MLSRKFAANVLTVFFCLWEYISVFNGIHFPSLYDFARDEISFRFNKSSKRFQDFFLLHVFFGEQNGMELGIFICAIVNLFARKWKKRKRKVLERRCYGCNFSSMIYLVLHFTKSFKIFFYFFFASPKNIYSILLYIIYLYGSQFET